MFKKKLFWIALFVGLFIGLLPMHVFALAQSTNGYFIVSGNKVYAPNGAQYIPEGISVYGGLEDTDFMENTANIDAQVRAAATYWHSNTIRLQVSESNLFSGTSKSSPYNETFVKELSREINLARSLNQVVVINDQTEFTNNTLMPTQETLKFWVAMSKLYGSDPYIIFDLFNEPRLGSITVGRPVLHRAHFHPTVINFLKGITVHKRQPANTKIIWKIWKYGGKYNGVNYLGMQTLVNSLRRSGVKNLIWIEGPYWGQRLPSGNYLIRGNNIVYSYHHVNLNKIRDWSFIGRMASRYAVVDGEWAQYQSPWQECYDSAPQSVPKYLDYLNSHGVGLIAWSLQAGSLLKGTPRIIPANNNSPQDPKHSTFLKTPSKLTRNYDCNNHFGQGAGSLIMHYFKANSHPI